MNKDNAMAWLGLNPQDTVINLSGLPLFLGLFIFSDLSVVGTVFLIAFLLQLSGLYLYFFRTNPKVSKKTAFFNKWLTVALVVIIWVLMLARLRMLIPA